MKAAIEAQSGGREVRILGATKMVQPERIEEAFRAGMRLFGENRIQEAIPKIERLKRLGAEWHFIGHLQSNKAAQAVAHFSCIQSVDSIRLMQAIDAHAAKAGKRVRLMLEVNLAEEQTKHGFDPAEIAAALEAGRQMKSSEVTGLMVIPPFSENADQVRPYFRRLREIRDRLRPDFPGLTELSMGMSHDYLAAVQEGSTLVRVGTAVFGERPPRSGTP